MGWKATNVMDQRTEFAMRAVRGLESMSELCREFGISRKTGYKWKERFLSQGLSGLHDQSRRPESCPSSLSEDIICHMVRLKQAHPSWGPKKLRLLMQKSGVNDVPSISSFKRVLEKAGLVKKRRARTQRETGRLQSRPKSERPNQVWTIDFKGWWRTRDHGRFEPLTVRDDFSRFILCARSLKNTASASVRPQMERLFTEHGLPEIIRSDNGSPFAAACSPYGLTRLSAWWLSLGIDLDRIRPGKPHENGAHERMHRDMADLERHAARTAQEQQAVLDTWRNTFNHERPHEALGMKVPAEVYCSSSREFDPTGIELSYPPGMLVRRIHSKGGIKLHSQNIYISTALAGFNVGLEALDDWRYSVWFGRLPMGEVDLQAFRFEAAQ